MSKQILLIIGGGIAAYKSLFLIRLLAKQDVKTRVILTKAGAEFVTPLSIGALSGDKVYSDLWNLTDEAEMGHIELSRAADLIVVAPASANMLAKAAHGLAADLATTTLLATDKRILYVPAMNVRMWEAAATQRNIAQLKGDGAFFIGPDAGAMACGEFGDGRMAEPESIADEIMQLLAGDTTLDGYRAGLDNLAHISAVNPEHSDKPLKGKSALITAGPTREPIDPVRYLSNHSSGKQGYALASALTDLGAKVTLVSGPTALKPPGGVDFIAIETAREMLSACEAALPCDIFISVAAVADWRPAKTTQQKTKKPKNGPPPLALIENPDILKTLCHHAKRPELVIGFAAETHNVIEHAKAKRLRKGCDWIIANDVSGDIMGGDDNAMICVTDKGEQAWPRQSKIKAAQKLAQKIAEHFEE